MSDSANLSSQQRSDEIDLIELIRILWDKKWWIVLTTFVTTLLAGIYAFTAKEQWTSKAELSIPGSSSLGSYLESRSEYASIMNVKDFTSQKVIDDLFDSFKIMITSKNVKTKFLEQSKWFEKYVYENGNSEEKKQKFISLILEKYLIVSLPDLRKNADSLSINVSFSAETPLDAQEVLVEYINFVNNLVLDRNKADFLADINIAISNLELQKGRFLFNIESFRQSQIENLNTALEIAKLAGIKEYIKTMDNISIHQVNVADNQSSVTDSRFSGSNNNLFMFGEKYLQAQIDILRKNKLTYPSLFYTIEKNIALLKELAKKENNEYGEISSYYYLASPDYPINKDKPKTAVILLISVLVGLLLAISTILLQYLFKRNK